MYSPQQPEILFIVDTGASAHITPEGPDTYAADEPTVIELPNGTTITSVRLRQLPITADGAPLPTAATTALALPGFTKNLISVGQLCDIGCSALFERNTVTIRLGAVIILTGTRDRNTNLWMATLPRAQAQPPPTSIVHAYTVVRTHDML